MKYSFQLRKTPNLETLILKYPLANLTINSHTIMTVGHSNVTMPQDSVWMLAVGNSILHHLYGSSTAIAVQQNSIDHTCVVTSTLL